MRVYFLAEKQSGLFLNGIYLGTVDGFERSVELEPRDGIFCELRAPGYLPVCFRLDEDFLYSPPPAAEVYFSRGEAAIVCRGFVRADPSLSVLKQERLGGALLTLCMQGTLSLHLDCETGFHIIPLPERFSDCTFRTCGRDFLLECEDAFLLVSRDGTVPVRADGKVLGCDETLRAEISFHDSAGHTAAMEWRDGKLLSCAIRSPSEPREATFALALFESALIGADCAPYLAPELLGKAKDVRGFLGDFCDVVLTAERDVVGLVYPRKERIYDVRYFRVTIRDGKISNITETE